MTKTVNRLKTELEDLKDYNEFICDKYEIGYPSWAQTKKVSKTKKALGLKEANRVLKKIDELSRCKRHKGIFGLDCNYCHLEGAFS